MRYCYSFHFTDQDIGTSEGIPEALNHHMTLSPLRIIPSSWYSGLINSHSSTMWWVNSFICQILIISVLPVLG